MLDFIVIAKFHVFNATHHIKPSVLKFLVFSINSTKLPIQWYPEAT